MRILIVDGVKHSRDSLAAFLHLHECLEVVGETADAVEAIQQTRHHQPDVVIMDINLPGLDGFTATRQLMELEAPPAVILLTVHRRVRDLLMAQEAGAVACIEKSAGVDPILETLHLLSIKKSRQMPQ